MRKGFKKEVELSYHDDQRQVVRWTIWDNTLDNDKKWLRLYVDAYGSHYGYVFGNYCRKPRSLWMPLSDKLYDSIMDKENTYDLYYDEDIQDSINNYINPSNY